jgi:hypothetical protein
MHSVHHRSIAQQCALAEELHPHQATLISQGQRHAQLSGMLRFEQQRATAATATCNPVLAHHSCSRFCSTLMFKVSPLGRCAGCHHARWMLCHASV